MATGYDNIGKGGIVKEGIFVRFPELIPACDDEIFWSSENHSRLLIVAESNYFEDEAESVYKSVFKNPEAWYQGEDRQHLIPITGKEPEEYKVKVSNFISYRTINKLCKPMKEVSGLNCNPIYKEAMFYNYFLRPATKQVNGKRGFVNDCKQLDRIVAGTALCGIIDLVNPDIVIFVSKYAYDEFKKYAESVGYEYNPEKINFVCHPASFGPNGWYYSKDGKQKFERLLREYWIKK